MYSVCVCVCVCVAQSQEQQLLCSPQGQRLLSLLQDLAHYPDGKAKRLEEELLAHFDKGMYALHSMGPNTQNMPCIMSAPPNTQDQLSQLRS